MTYNVLKLCEDKGDYFECDPAVMFPATLARIKEVLAGNPPVELVKDATIDIPWFDPVAKKFYDQAKALPAGALDKPSKEALDLAESWFKRALALKAERGIRIHFSCRPEYRR